jgi:hypothetical protein
MHYYTYMWLREDLTPYYIGKGTGDRAFISDGHGVHRPKDRSRILILLCASEQEALEAEIKLIAYWGRKDLGTGCLRNLTDGGDNPPKCKKGSKKSEAYVLRMRSRRHTEESSRKMSSAQRGRKLSKETRLKMKEAAKRVWTPEACKANSDRLKGHETPQEVRDKISKTLTGRKRDTSYITPEYREKMRHSLLGRIPWNKGQGG